MQIAKALGLSLVALSIVTLSAVPASARPHRHQVCHMERHHGHHVRVCRWVR